MKRVRTLLRVSSKQQLHDDDIPVQRAEADSFIAMHSDWKFDKEYIEKAVSAYKNSVEDREVLQDILKDAKNKEFDILLTYMSDRIGRKEEYSFYVATLNNLGIEIWTIKDGQLRTEEHVDKLLNFIRFWQNEGESKKTADRVRDAQKEAVKSGKFVGGKAPYGYDLVLSGEISNHGRALHKLVINEEQAQIVRKIYDYAVNYEYGAFKIAGILNEEGVKPINDAWRTGTISGILKNPAYMGYVSYCRRKGHTHFTRLDRKDWIYANEQNKDITIVDQKVWEKVQLIRESRKKQLKESEERNHYGNIKTTGKLVLMGVAYCGYCGTRLTNGSVYNHWTTQDGERHSKISGRYKCTKRANAIALCEGAAFYRQEELEGIVFDVIGDYLDRMKQENVCEKVIEAQESQRTQIKKEVTAMKKQLKVISEDIKTLENKIPNALRGDCAFTPEKLSELIEAREEEKKSLSEQISHKESEYEKTKLSASDIKDFSNMIPNWREEFEKAPVQTKKVIISNLIERVEVKRDGLRIKFQIGEDFFQRPITSGFSVPQQRLRFHHHLLYRLRPEIRLRQKRIPEHFKCSRRNVPKLSFPPQCPPAHPDPVL